MTIFRRFLNWLARTIHAIADWLDERPGGDSPSAVGEIGASSALSPDDQNDTDQVRVIAEPTFALETLDDPHYVKELSLFSHAESEMFRKLLGAIGQDFQIFAKVRLVDVMYLQNLPKDSKYHNNQIQCKHFDFVLCHFRSHEPLLAIELNDESHSRYDRTMSDQFKQTVCDEIGLPLLWLYVGDRMSVAQLAREVHTKISPSGASAEPG